MNRTNFFLSLTAFISLSVFFSCSKPNEEKPNRPPGSFIVTVSNVTFNSATVNWTAAVDPENEAVTYAVELNGQSAATGLNTTTQNLTALTKNTTYNGKVTAKDASGYSTAINFTFNTSDTPAPSDFAVKVDASTNKSLTVSWTAATLPTNEAVTYDVYSGTTLASANQTQTSYTFTGLTPQTSYALKVIAKSAGGKSTEKTLSAQTAANTAPAQFSAESLEHGFSFIKLKWTAATDSNGDSLSYFLSRNGNLTPLTEAPVNGSYTYVVKGLNPSTAYSVSVVAKDAYGGEASSNAVQVTTNNGPENNFAFSARNDGSDVVIEWTQAYTAQFQTATSTYSINNVEKSLSGVQVNFLNLGGGKMYVKAYLNGSDFPQNEARQIKLKLNWGANETQTQSKTVSHTRYAFSATAAETTSAIIKRHSNGDYGFVLTFKNDIISDYSEWTVKEVKFDNSIQPGTISLQFAMGKTVQSVFGNLTESDYNYLKTKSEGFIVIHDAGGYHRINFTFTAL